MNLRILLTLAGALACGAAAAERPLFDDVTAQLAHRHHENEFDDFARQLLLPNRLGQFGPGIAWCDLDGDGRDDLILGSGAGGRLGVKISEAQGGFRDAAGEGFAAPADFGGVVAWRGAEGEARIFAGIANYEDGDTQRDAAAGWTFRGDGGRTAPGVPGGVASTGPIAFADIDGSGRLAVFIGGRVVPGRYPEPAASRLGRWKDGTFAEVEGSAAVLKNAGLVSGAVFSDLNGDGFPDLVLALEWGPVRVLMNDGKGRFADRTEALGLGRLTGWWNGVTAGDLDGDGRMDIVATNWGRNSKYQHSFDALHPLRVSYGDLLGDGSVQIVENHFDEAMQKLVPERGLSCSSTAMPFIKTVMPTYKAFGEAGLPDIYGARLKRTKTLSAATLDHTVFLNRGDHFEARSLPIEAQFAPGFGVSVADLDGDGSEDVVMTQNFFASQIETPRCDGGRGLVLLGDGRGGLRPMTATASGLAVYGDARGLAVGDFDGDRRPDVAVGQNAAATRLFHNVGARPCLRVVLRGPAGNPQGFGAVVRLKSGAAMGPAREVHGGSGFWSQDAATPLLSGAQPPTGVWVRWPGGKISTVEVATGATAAEAVFPDGGK